MSKPLHFTIGTGPGFHPAIQQLSLENDLLLVKASLLYADRVRLCSIGSALALQFAQLMGASADQRLDWLERHFEALAPTYPEEAATMRKFFRLYGDLRKRKRGTLSKSEIHTKFQVQAGLRRAWDNFEEGIGEFLRIAGADGIVEALETGLLDLHRFEADGIEGMGGLSQEGDDQMSDELFGALTWEYFDLIAEAVADGETNPLFDRASGSFFQAGVEAGVIEPSESGTARGRHSGLASDLLQRLPLFERATVQEILEIRRELEAPLARFRGAVIDLSEGIRSAAWDEDFPSDADTAFRKAVEPAILDIEEAVRSNSSLRELLLRGVRPEALASGLGLMLGSLAALPDLAALALGSGSTVAITGREAYREWKSARENIGSNQMYFYYEARERLAISSPRPSPSVSLQRGNRVPQNPVWEEKPKGARMDVPETDAEREAREFIEESQPLLDDGGVSTLQRVIVQGAPIATELSGEVVEAANQLTAATNALTDATKNPATRPRKMFELERELDRLKPVYERKKKTFDDFSAFMDRAQAAHKQKGSNL